jgi:serine/threonine protein kinase
MDASVTSPPVPDDADLCSRPLTLGNGQCVMLQRRPLAAGTFGRVFLGMLQPGGTAVVLKQRECGVRPGEFAYYQREHEIAHQVHAAGPHPHIVQQLFYSYKPTGNGYVFLSLQEFAGRSLFAVMQDDPRNLLVLARLLPAVLDGLLPALAFLHGLGIVHKDVTTQNVMVATDGGFRVRLGDFGSANYTGTELDVATAHDTRPPEGMEVWRGAQGGVATPAYDAWSAAVVVMHVMLGASPFVSRLPQDLQRAYAMAKADGLVSDKTPPSRELDTVVTTYATMVMWSRFLPVVMPGVPGQSVISRRQFGTDADPYDGHVIAYCRQDGAVCETRPSELLRLTLRHQPQVASDTVVERAMAVVDGMLQYRVDARMLPAHFVQPVV